LEKEVVVLEVAPIVHLMRNKKQLEHKTIVGITQHQLWEKEVATKSRRRENSQVLNQQSWIRLYIYGINMIEKGCWGLLELIEFLEFQNSLLLLLLLVFAESRDLH
jgi:hypothetical protein